MAWCVPCLHLMHWSMIGCNSPLDNNCHCWRACSWFNPPTKVVFTLELVWLTFWVEPRSIGWCKQKNNQTNPTRIENFTLEITGFDMGPTRIERSVNRNRWLWPGLPEMGNLIGIAWAAESGLKGCFSSPALSLATSYDFWHGVADVFDDFVQATTVAYYRHWHPPWWSKVTDHWHETVNFRVQYANLPMRIEARRISPR